GVTPGHLVREARPVVDGHAPLRALVQRRHQPAWETKTDFETFRLLAEKVSELSHGHLDIRTDVVATPLGHDTPDALANPGGTVSDWKDGSCERVPGKNFPKITAVERDYRLLGEKFGSLGPLAEKVGMPVKGLMLKPDTELGVRI